MIPDNGTFQFVSHITLTGSDQLIPEGTTHMVFGSADSTHVYGTLAFKVNVGDDVGLRKALLPLGTFIRLSSLLPGIGEVLTEGSAPASTITSVTCYKWTMNNG